MRIDRKLFPIFTVPGMSFSQLSENPNRAPVEGKKRNPG